jgi:hypothetical protein
MIVLTVLFIFGIWIFTSVFLARRIPRWVGIPQHTTAASVVIFPIVLAVPVTDEIVGNAYMENVLCKDANKLEFTKSIDSVRRARATQVPRATIWFGIPIEKLQVDYVDLDTNEVFASSKNFITYGGVLMRLGLNLGNFGSCGRWTLNTRNYSGPDSADIELDKLLKAGVAN